MEQSQELIMIYLSYVSLTTAILQNKQGMSYRIGVVKIKEVKWIMTSSIKIVEQLILGYALKRFDGVKNHVNTLFGDFSFTSFDIQLISKKNVNLARNIE